MYNRYPRGDGRWNDNDSQYNSGSRGRGHGRGGRGRGRGRGCGRGGFENDRGAYSNRTPKGTRDDLDFGYDSEFSFGMGSVNVGVSYQTPRNRYRDDRRYGNRQNDGGFQGRRKQGLGYNSSPANNNPFNNSNSNNNRYDRNEYRGNRNNLDFNNRSFNSDMPEPYSRSNSAYLVPIYFVKSTEIYNPSAEINAYLASHKNKSTKIIEDTTLEKEVLDNQSSLQNLKIQEESTTSEDVVNTDGSNSEDDSELGIEDLSQFASFDIGGEGEGMSYNYGIPDNDADGGQSLTEYLGMSYEDSEEIDAIKAKYFSSLLIVKDLDSENSWGRLYGPVPEEKQDQLPFVVHFQGFDTRCHYKDISNHHQGIPIPSFQELVTMINKKGRYHTILDDRSKHEELQHIENKDAYVASKVGDLINEPKDIDNPSLATVDRNDKKQQEEKHVEEKPLEDLISEMSGQQNSKKKSKSARRLEREQYEEMGKLTDPDYNATKPKRNTKPDFSKADPLFRSDMEDQFETARKNQALKKMERQLQRDLAKSQTKAMLRGENTRRNQELTEEITEKLMEKRKQMLVPKNGYVNLSYKYPVFMTILDAVFEIENFILNMDRMSIPFPRMSPEDIELVKELAVNHYGLETKLKGGDLDPHLTLIKTSNTTLATADHFGVHVILLTDAGERLWNLNPNVNPNLLTSKMLRKIKYRNIMIKRSSQMGTEKPSRNKNQKLKDGHIVGSDAKEITADNIGHQMLMKLGWTKGTGLGSERRGISEPLAATFKGTKLGLGNGN